MPIYVDTSLLASYYLPDANTTQAIAALQGAGSPALYTALHRLELRSAMARAVFRRSVTATDAQAAWQNVSNDGRWFAAAGQNQMVRGFATGRPALISAWANNGMPEPGCITRGGRAASRAARLS